MKRYLPLIVILLLPLMISCSSGEKAMEKGNYYEAVMKSIKRLRSNPNKQKALQTIKQAYPLAVRYHQQQIQQTLASANPLKWTRVVGHYQTLNRLAQEIDRCPAALNIITDFGYFITELEDAKSQAGPECYNAGIQALQEGTRESAKIAYSHFKKANQFVPGYRDVQQKIEEAHYMATLKVVLENIPLASRQFKLSADFFQDQVEAYLRQNMKKEFVRFYTPEEAEQEKLEYPDHIIRIEFEDFVVGETHELTQEKQLISKDSVKVGEVTLDNGKKAVVYNKVKAKLITHKREVISKGLLNLQIIEYRNNSILKHERIPGEFIWFSQWGNFNGDKRALTPKQLEICNLEPIPAPPAQVLFVEFTKPIYIKLISRLRSFYNRY